MTATATRPIINNASGHGPRSGPMVVANRWSHHRGKRQAQAAGVAYSFIIAPPPAGELEIAWSIQFAGKPEPDFTTVNLIVEAPQVIEAPPTT